MGKFVEAGGKPLKLGGQFLITPVPRRFVQRARTTEKSSETRAAEPPLGPTDAPETTQSQDDAHGMWLLRQSIHIGRTYEEFITPYMGSPDEFWPLDLLPFPKSDILAALTLSLSSPDADEASDARLLMLAQFQELDGASTATLQHRERERDHYKRLISDAEGWRAWNRKQGEGVAKRIERLRQEPPPAATRTSSLDRALHWFAWVWVGLVILINLAATTGMIITAPSLAEGLAVIWGTYSSFNLGNFVLELILVSPAIAAYAWLECRRKAVRWT